MKYYRIFSIKYSKYIIDGKIVLINYSKLDKKVKKIWRNPYDYSIIKIE